MPTQSEQVLEDNLVAQLISQGYEPVDVTDETSLLANLKSQLEAFNQTNRYQRHSYLAGSGLFNFIN